MDIVDILIVGAGPTGLLMAYEAHRHGLTCRLIEKSPTPSDKSKALAIQARTVEILYHLGLSEEFLKQGLKVARASPVSNGTVITQVDFCHLDSDFPFVLVLEQNKTEKILSDHVASLGIKIERGVELMSFEMHETYVKSTLLNHKTAQTETVYSSWIIGCDGAHSLVRKSLGLSYKGTLFGDVFSLADIQLQWKYPHNELFAFLNAEGIIAAIPLPEKDHYRLIFQLKRCRDLLSQVSRHGIVSSDVIPNPTVDEIETLLHKYCDKDAKVIGTQWMANFHINSRLSNHYRKKRAFLVGDAAHIHSPVGGQGMNTGFSDAFNLTWKLALVHRKKAKESLLDTYEKERHRVGETLLKATKTVSQIATLHNPFLIWVRNHLMNYFVKKAPVQKHIIEALSQISIRYPKSRIVHEEGSFINNNLKVGMRAPNASVIYQNHSTTLFDLWKCSKSFQLLIFCDCTTEDRKIDFDLVEKFFSHEEDRIEIYFVTQNHSYAKKFPHKKILVDLDGSFYKRYDIFVAGLYLIRPDFYIGYRRSDLTENAFLSAGITTDLI